METYKLLEEDTFLQKNQQVLEYVHILLVPG
jgi:hypothetical protein